MKFAHLLGHLHATFLRHGQFIFLQKEHEENKEIMRHANRNWCERMGIPHNIIAINAIYNDEH